MKNEARKEATAKQKHQRTIRAADVSVDVLLIFVGHSRDAKNAAARVKQLESKVQGQLERLDIVMNGGLRFRRAKIYEWDMDAPPFVDGQKQIDRRIDQAHVGIFVFQDLVGDVTKDELARCRKQGIPVRRAAEITLPPIVV